MQHILEIQRAAFAVFEPFLRGLVTANVEIPRAFGNILKILGGAAVHAADGFESLSHRTCAELRSDPVAFEGVGSFSTTFSSFENATTLRGKYLLRVLHNSYCHAVCQKWVGSDNSSPTNRDHRLTNTCIFNTEKAG